MSVYLPKDCKTWRYRFKWRGRWYKGSTGQFSKADAELVDKQEQIRVRREAHGIAPYDPARSPHLQRWSEVYYREVKKNPNIKRPERIKDLLRVALRFCGARPAQPTPKDVGEPFHHLRLGDFITEPKWIQDFENWMDRHHWSGQTKNQYRSVMSQMYELAGSHTWRQMTQVTENPFRRLRRDPKVSRTVTNSIDELRAVLATAAYHVRLAVSIGLLAHKLRLDNILTLTWSENVVDFGPREFPNGRTVYGWIVVYAHKTEKALGEPLVVPITKQLYDILLDARQRSRSNSVVTYRGEPISDVRGGLRLACERAGVTYGRFAAGGTTFHTLRHTSSTEMAVMGIPEQQRKNAAGHRSIQTTQGYTHLRPVHEIEPLEQLSSALPIADLVTARQRLTPDPRPDQQRSGNLSIAPETSHNHNRARGT